MFLDAVLMCDELDIHLPHTQADLFQLANGFDAISNAQSTFFGVIGAIDGWLCTTNKPSDVPNPGDFYSGHYKRFGLNVQGKSSLVVVIVVVVVSCCRHRCRRFCCCCCRRYSLF